MDGVVDGVLDFLALRVFHTNDNFHAPCRRNLRDGEKDLLAIIRHVHGGHLERTLVVVFGPVVLGAFQIPDLDRITLTSPADSLSSGSLKPN